MKIWVQPGGDDRRVPWPSPSPTKAPRYFPMGVPTAVELDHYIQRRLDDGDLVQVEAPPAPAAAKPAAAATKAEG